MQNSVTTRFIECYHLLLEENGVRSARQFALSLNFYAQSFNEVLKGRRDVTVDLIARAVKVYSFNPSYLFGGTGPKMLSQDISEEETVEKGFSEITYIPWDQRTDYSKVSSTDEEKTYFAKLKVPHPGYFQNATKAFEYRGQSLNPCLEDGDVVISRRIPKAAWQRTIAEGFIYVFVTEDKIAFARVVDWLMDKQELLLSSSAADQDNSELVTLEDIQEVWELRARLTSKVPSPVSRQYCTNRKLTDVAAQLKMQNDTILSLNVTVEKLLKQNRSLRL